MTTEPNTQSVTIFGSEYKIRGADPDYIQVVAAFVDGKMRELEQRLPAGTPTKLAILTSLNIADELFREREEKTRREHELKERARQWERALGECLDEGPIGDR
jgi:cell division protein ZapA